MVMRSLLGLIFLGLLSFNLLGNGALNGALSNRAWAAERPNIVAIVTDDQGRWACGAYGNADIHTPHMDSLARDGALFTSAMTNCPVCSPSRAIYFTGQYPTQLGITDWISPAEAAAGLGLSAPTWPQALQAAGYRTGLIGKWHLGHLPEFHPTRRGFDHFSGFLDGGNRPQDPILEVNGEATQLSGPLPDLLTDAAIRFVEESRASPFLLCLHFRAPHLPYGPVPEADARHYAGRRLEVPDVKGVPDEWLQRETRGYYASISSVDRNIGRLLGRLAELGLDDDTIVIFTSDHGYNLGRHRVDTKGNAHWIVGGISGPKRPNMWETSLQVPLLIRYPGVVPPGTVIDRTVTFVDFYRTMLALADVPLPEAAQPAGRDFSPLLTGHDLPEPAAVFGQYDLHNGGLAFMRMIRTPRFKLVRHLHSEMLDELYDLQADPDEQRNLYGRNPSPEHRAVIDQLDQQLRQWQASINDPLRDASR